MRRVLRRVGSCLTSAAGGYRIAVPNDRSAVDLAQSTHLCQIVIGQSIVPVGELLHRIVEPVFLVLIAGLENSTAEYMAEQLVSGLVESTEGCIRSLPGFATSHSNVVSFRWCLEYSLQVYAGSPFVSSPGGSDILGRCHAAVPRRLH